MRVDNPVGLQLLSGTSLLAAVEEDGTSGLVMTWVRLMLMLYFFMVAHPVEGLLEVYEDVVEVLLVLEIFLTENA